MELVRSKSDKPLKATRFAAIRNGIITVLCAALCCLQSAFATPLPGKCDKALYGLSNDGRFLFSLSQPAFSPNLEISVFALPELTSEVVTFHDMPIDRSGIRTPRVLIRFPAPGVQRRGVIDVNSSFQILNLRRAEIGAHILERLT